MTKLLDRISEMYKNIDYISQDYSSNNEKIVEESEHDTKINE